MHNVKQWCWKIRIIALINALFNMKIQYSNSDYKTLYNNFIIAIYLIIIIYYIYYMTNVLYLWCCPTPLFIIKLGIIIYHFFIGCKPTTSPIFIFLPHVLPIFFYLHQFVQFIQVLIHFIHLLFLLIFINLSKSKYLVTEYNKKKITQFTCDLTCSLRFIVSFHVSITSVSIFVERWSTSKIDSRTDCVQTTFSCVN